MKNFYVISTLVLCSSVAFAQGSNSNLYQPWGAKAAQQPQQQQQQAQNQQGNGGYNGQPNNGQMQGNGYGNGQMQGNGQYANGNGYANNGQPNNGQFGNGNGYANNGQPNSGQNANGNRYNNGQYSSDQTRQGQGNQQGQGQGQDTSNKGYAVNDKDKDGSGQPADVYVAQKNKKQKTVFKKPTVSSGDLKGKDTDSDSDDVATTKEDPRGKQIDMTKSDESDWSCSRVMKCNNGNEVEATVYGRNCTSDFVNNELVLIGLNEEGFVVERRRTCGKSGVATLDGESINSNGGNGNGGGGGGVNGGGGPNGGPVGGPNGGPVIGGGGPVYLPAPVFVPVPVAPVYRPVRPAYPVCRQPGMVGCNGGGYPPVYR